MVYKIDGSSHKNGVKSEIEVSNFLNEFSLSGWKQKKLLIDAIKKASGLKLIKDLNFKHTGTTKNIDDILEIKNNLKISLKTRQRKNTTIDLINTSKLENIISKENITFYMILKEFEDYKKDLRNRILLEIPDKKIVRKDIKSIYIRLLNSLSEKDIHNLFSKIQQGKPDITLIREKYSEAKKLRFNNLYFLEHNWLEKEVKQIAKKQSFTNEKGSEFIKYQNGANSPFRIRIALNNGISALLKEKGITQSGKAKNTNSCLTLKIQIDRVQEIINKYSISTNNHYKDEIQIKKKRSSSTSM